MSSSVFVNNLDDFIAPSQACVNPTVAAKLSTVSESTATTKGGKGKITLLADYSTTDYEDYAKPVVQPDLIKSKTISTTGKSVATVSLNDCLACSGCVTSAEAVLIAEQSNQKFIRVLEEALNSPRTKLVVVQISPNSRASLADFLGIHPSEAFQLIAAALKSRGVKYVVDSSVGADVFLMETREEFMQRFLQGRSKSWTTPPTTTANSSTSINTYPVVTKDGSVPVATSASAVPDMCTSLPLFTSHCPGWVCYAEKTAPQAIPYMSTVKSAQQIVGALMKGMLRHVSHTIGESLNGQSTPLSDLTLDHLSLLSNVGDINNRLQSSPEVVVVSIQPCFDKKLEASRLDFFHSAGNVHEVDLVLSTTELWETIVSFAQEWRVQQKLDVKEQSPALNGAAMEVCEPDEIRVDLDNQPPSSSATSSPLVSQRTRILSVYGYVLDFMRAQLSVTNELTALDPIEQLFRQSSLHGSVLLTAAERNAGSGAVAEYVFRYAAQQLYGLDLWSVPELQYKAGRNPDYVEVDLQHYLTPSVEIPDNCDGTSITVTKAQLKFGRAYGFRNIQSLLLKMKRGLCDLDLIEVMACPSGCNNGGGQLKNFGQLLALSALESSESVSTIGPPLTETVAESKARAQAVDAVFHQHVRYAAPETAPLVMYLYDSQRLQRPLSEAARMLLHTRYHAVPKLETIAPLAAKW